MKVIKTNWINIAGVFLTVFIYALILNLNDPNVSRNLFQVIVSALMLVCLYGIMFWGLLIILLVILDLILITRNQNNLKIKLLVEWLIIASPFIYWVIRYNQWIFLVGIITFLLTQLLREKLIVKAVH